MFHKLLLVVIISGLASFNCVYAQNQYKVTGRVIDSTLSPINDANIMLISESDTLKTTSDKNGEYIFKITDLHNFRLKISHIGYTEFNRLFSSTHDSENLRLDPIKLKIYTKKLAEVSVKAKVQPILFKKDTTEYNVGSFTVDDNDFVEDLLKKLPGLELDRNKNLTSEGKQVTKLRVNGRDFFTGNIQEFITQLPAGILSKVQIINDYGDDAAFSGIKTVSSAKMLNLVTKSGMNNGIFGNVSANVGTNKLTGANITGNYWKDTKQISSNVDLQNATTAIGASINNRANLSYANQLGKHLMIGGVYSFNSSRTSAENNTFSETINSLGTINNYINSKSFIKNNTHAFKLNSKYEPDRKTYMKLNIILSTGNSKDSSATNSQQTGIINQDLISSSSSDNKNPVGSVDFTIGKKFNKIGRVVIANFQYSINNTNNINEINRNIRYYDTLGNFTKDSIFNNLITNKLKIVNIKTTLSYTEPLSSKSNLDFNYEFSITKQKTNLLTEVNLYPFGLLKIDSLSNQSDNSISTQKMTANYRFNGQKFSLVGGVSLQKNSLFGLYIKQAEKTQLSTYNFSPTVNLNYNPTSTTGLDLNYVGNSEMPNINELQPVQDTKDLQNVFIGNPKLRPAFIHQIGLNLHHFGNQSHHLLTAGISASLIQNKIVSNTVIIRDTLNSLKQLTSFINANGSYRLDGSYLYSLPTNLFGLKLNTNFSGSINFARQVVYTDNFKAFNFSRSISQTIKTAGRFKQFDSDLSVNYTTSSNRYTIGQGLTNNVHRWLFSLSENFTFTKYTSLGIDANKSLIYGYTNINSNNPFIINASVKRLFFKQSLSIKLQANDILNQANKINQTIVGNSIVNNKTNYISRFIILSASYRISKFGHLK